MDGLVKIVRPGESLRVCVEMLQHEDPERDNPGQLMKFAQDKSPAQANRQMCTPLPLSIDLKANGPNLGRLLLRFFRARKLYGEVAEKQNANNSISVGYLEERGTIH